MNPRPNPGMDFTKELKTAMESLDPDKMLDLFSEDVTFRAPGLDQPIQGRDTLRPWTEGALDAIESLDIDVKRSIQKGNQLALLVDVDVAYKDDLHYGDIAIPTEGKTSHIEAALFATLDENGRAKDVVRVRNDWAIMKDIGMSGQQMDDLMERANQMLKEIQSGASTEHKTA